eukprot:7075051-Alexandrium_andersonii.AAC.2
MMTVGMCGHACSSPNRANNTELVAAHFGTSVSRAKPYSDTRMTGVCLAAGTNAMQTPPRSK